MGEIRSPLVSYVFSDPLIHLDLHNEEKQVECLDIEKEKHMIKGVLESTKSHARWVAKVATEQNFVSSYCDSDIFHFTGHGIDGSMAFETETGELKFVNVSDLREMCRSLPRKPTLLFLSMCHGKQVGLAFKDLGVDHVITVCNDRILDKASLLFADQFYRGLVSGFSVGDSFEQGLARLQDSFPEEKAKYFLTGNSESHSTVLFPNVCSPSEASTLTCAPAVDITPPLPFSNSNEVTSFFIGRRKEVYHCFKALVNKNRCVNLVGPQGIGKSQIALAAGAYCRDRHAFDAILYWDIDQDSLFFEGEYFSRLYRVFGLDHNAVVCDLELLIDRIRNKWGEKHILCIIDGVVSPAVNGAGASFVRKFINGILKRIKNVYVLATSRDQLITSHPVRVVSVGPLQDIFAAELFVLRSPGSLTKGELTQFETDLVSDNPLIAFSKTAIIQSLCGNPLVIERAAMATVGRNLLLHRTDFIMNIIPRIVSDITSATDTVPDSPVALSRSISERSPSHGGPFLRSASESQRGAFDKVVLTASPVMPAPTVADDARVGTLSEAEVEDRLISTYKSILGSSRPLSESDLIFLKKKLMCDDQLTVTQEQFQKFYAWYTNILACFSRSEMWLRPGCIHGFLNKDEAKEILSTLPNISEKKGVFIIGVSETEACLVLSFVTDNFSVLPCKIYFDCDAVDAPFSVRTRSASGACESLSFDKLASVIIHLQQLTSFYPGEDKFEKLGMLPC